MYSINLDEGFLEFKIAGETRNKSIPPMLFIPLIENVIKHSNKKVNKPGIKIELLINESQIQLKTSNFTKETHSKSKNNGMGLNNLRKRLELLYEDNHELTIKNDEIFHVNLSIPLWKK